MHCRAMLTPEVMVLWYIVMLRGSHTDLMALLLSTPVVPVPGIKMAGCIEQTVLQ